MAIWEPHSNVWELRLCHSLILLIKEQSNICFYSVVVESIHTVLIYVFIVTNRIDHLKNVQRSHSSDGRSFCPLKEQDAIHSLSSILWPQFPHFNLDQLLPLVRLGTFGFNCFMVTEDTVPQVLLIFYAHISNRNSKIFPPKFSESTVCLRGSKFETRTPNQLLSSLLSTVWRAAGQILGASVSQCRMSLLYSFLMRSGHNNTFSIL